MQLAKSGSLFSSLKTLVVKDPGNVNARVQRNLKTFLKAAATVQAKKNEQVHIADRKAEPLCDCDHSGMLHKCNISEYCQYKVNQVPVYIRTYGCQMNVNDTDIVKSILTSYGYKIVDDDSKAAIYLLMTCAIRDSAESKIWGKLHSLREMKANPNHPLKQVGLLGCMAERLKDKVLEKSKLVDIVAGPDAYRDLARLFSVTQLSHEKAINCLLSFDETYSDISPVTHNNQVSSFVSITRGCDNLCSYCIVPFTRGRERSRPIETIINEVKELYSRGIRQVTLLGQNVNSYSDLGASPEILSKLDLDIEKKSKRLPAQGFKTVYKPKTKGITFDVLLEEVAKVGPELRIRFTSPHPKDFTDDVIKVMAKYPNICKCVHLPAQSGSSAILEKMRRGYTREAYLDLVRRMREAMPNLAITSDFIAGFCDETEEDHQQTIDLIRKVNYSFIYAFPYSSREKTHAFHALKDNVDKETKQKRTDEIINLSQRMILESNQKLIGSTQLVLIEGDSRHSSYEFQGRIDCNLKTIVPKKFDQQTGPIHIGDYVKCRIKSSTSHTARAATLSLTTMEEYHEN